MNKTAYVTVKGKDKDLDEIIEHLDHTNYEFKHFSASYIFRQAVAILKEVATHGDLDYGYGFDDCYVMEKVERIRREVEQE